MFNFHFSFAVNQRHVISNWKPSNLAVHSGKINVSYWRWRCWVLLYAVFHINLFFFTCIYIIICRESGMLILTVTDFQ